MVKSRFSRFGFAFAIGCSLAILSACGGGDGGSSSPPASVPTKVTSPQGPATPAMLLPPSSTPVTVTASGDAKQDGIAFVNAMRQNLGYVSSLAIDNGLATASQNHATYLVDNQTYGHNETQGLQGYSGATPDARIQAAGSYTAYGEVVIAGVPAAFSDSLAPVRTLFDAPYHRMVMLGDFGSMGVAYDASASWEAFNIDFGNSGSALSPVSVVAYPYSGETGVPTTWFANESPNPFASQPQYELTNVGYPVTIQGGWQSTFSGMNFVITDGNGNTVPCLMQSPDNNPSELSNGAMCIPYTPLQANMKYTVHVTGTMTSPGKVSPNEGRLVDLTWQFTTRAATTAGYQANGQGNRPLPKF